MIARLSSLVVWALAAVAAVAWGLRVSGRMTPVPPHASLAATAAPVAGDYSRVLGTPPVAEAPVQDAPLTDARFKLLGVVAQQRGRDAGLALISVDGKPARAVRLGAEVEPGVRVLSVSQRQVELGGDGRPVVALALPALPLPQRGRPGEAMQAATPDAGFAAPPGLRSPPGGRLALPGTIDPVTGRLVPLPGASAAPGGVAMPPTPSGLVPNQAPDQNGAVDPPDNSPQLR